MIPIRKGREPNELLRYRLDKSAGEPTYENMPANVKEAVLESLMREQGYLCAYCMCRIPQDSSKHWPPVTIEHINPQSGTNLATALDYDNMLAVCSGNRNSDNEQLMGLGNARLTCDACRGNSALTVNPLDSRTLTAIHYKNDGTIYSDDSVINNDLNVTLNLNCDAIRLPETRKAAKEGLLKEVSKHRSDIQNYIQRTLEHYQTASKKPPYVGILIDWLKRHQR